MSIALKKLNVEKSYAIQQQQHIRFTSKDNVVDFLC